MKKILLVSVVIVIALSACKNRKEAGYMSGDYGEEAHGATYTLHEAQAVISVKNYDGTQEVKNIILLIGDGMGFTQMYSGMVANRGKLNMENFRYTGISKTSSASDLITDSGAGGTAIACGQKTYNGAIGVDPNMKPIQSILEIAETKGLATGLVATSKITHATPASFIAHVSSRNEYDSIAADFLKTDIEVFIGGGRDNFNKREDGVNLLDQLKENGYSVAATEEEMAAVKEGKLAALLTEGHMPPVMERGDILNTATMKALDLLSQDENGFFLMVESSQIDWAGHDNNIEYMVNEVIDFDKVVGNALKFAEENPGTLVIVTADHETGGLVIDGGDAKTGTVEAKFATGHHSGVMVPVMAYGPKAEIFTGMYENTEIFNKMLEAYSFE